MKTNFIPIAVICILLAGTGSALADASAAYSDISAGADAKPLDSTWSVAADGRIEIGNVRGKVTVTGWDQPQVKLEGRKCASPSSSVSQPYSAVSTMKPVRPSAAPCASTTQASPIRWKLG